MVIFMSIVFLLTLSVLPIIFAFNLTYVIPNVKGFFESNYSDNETLKWIEISQVKSELNYLSQQTDLVKYFLYTRDNPKTGQRIRLGDKSSLQQSNFNKSNPTRIMVHGFNSSYTTTVCTFVRDAYLKTGPHNVICPDWSKISKTTPLTASICIPSVGYDLGRFIEFLIKDGGMNKKDLILAGHSYGTQIAGNAGKYMKRINNKLPLIIVLDPGKENFPYENPSIRISKTDADFVESIQTTSGRIGYLRPIGDGTYYPNGGRKQPGCQPGNVTLCSHLRAFEYFAEAIVKNDFPTIRCKNYKDALQKDCGNVYSGVKMASTGSFGVKGVFYVPVNSQPPFGKGS